MYEYPIDTIVRMRGKSIKGAYTDVNGDTVEWKNVKRPRPPEGKVIKEGTRPKKDYFKKTKALVKVMMDKFRKDEKRIHENT